MTFRGQDVIIDWSHACWGWETRQGAPERFRTDSFKLRHLLSLTQVIEMVAMHERVFVPSFSASPQWHHDTFATSLCYWLRDFGFEDKRLKRLFKGVGIPHWSRYTNLVPEWDSPRGNEVVDGDLGPFFDTAHGRLNLLSQQLATADFASKNGIAFAPYEGTEASSLARSIVELNARVTVPLYRAYGELWRALSEDTRELVQSGRTYPLPVPPLAALVFRRAKNREAIGSELLAVREEIRVAREAFDHYKQIILDPNRPLADALDAKTELDNIFHSLRLPYSEGRVSLYSWSDFLSLPKNLFDGLDAQDFESGSLIRMLLGKPLELIIEQIRRRKVAILFKAKRNYYTAETEKDVARLFGEAAVRDS